MISFVRRIAVNPVTGSTAVAIAVLSISEADEKTSVEGTAVIIYQKFALDFPISLSQTGKVYGNGVIHEKKKLGGKI